MTRSSSDPQRVSAIVVVYDTTAPRLERCLSALRASQGVEVEIIVVDNASPQPVRATGADITLERNSNGGFAAGVNDGIRVASAPWIAVVNDDAVVEPDALRQCVDALAAAPRKVLAAAPKVLFADSDVLDSCGIVVRPSGEAFSAGAGQPDLGQFDLDRTVLGPCLSAAVFRASAFTAVGLLDERYFLYYEDVDWALRCFLGGYDSVFVPTAVVHHEHAASTRTLGEQRRFRMVQRNLLLCATANLSWPSVTRVWAGRLIAAAKAVVKGPDRVSLVAAIGAAAARVPLAVGVRRERRRVATRHDDAAFAFAEGLQPFVDTTTYRPSHQQAALAAARARLTRRNPHG
jgi:GT2 family glycosyltransferase